MSLKWIFAMLVVCYGLSSLADTINFNQLIDKNMQTQNQIASEIQTQVGLSKQKSLKDLSVSEVVSLEGFNLRVF